MVYFTHVTFKDHAIRELTAGIEGVVSSTYLNPDDQAKLITRLDQLIAEAQQRGYIAQDRKPRFLKSRDYETFLKEPLGAINRDFKLGIRV